MEQGPSPLQGDDPNSHTHSHTHSLPIKQEKPSDDTHTHTHTHNHMEEEVYSVDRPNPHSDTSVSVSGTGSGSVSECVSEEKVDIPNARKLIFDAMLSHLSRNHPTHALTHSHSNSNSNSNSNNSSDEYSDENSVLEVVHDSTLSSSATASTAHTHTHTHTHSKLMLTCASKSKGCAKKFNLLDAPKAGTQGIFFMNETLTWECPEHRRIPPSFCQCTKTDLSEMIQCYNCNGWYHFECMNTLKELIPTDTDYKFHCLKCQASPKERHAALFQVNLEKETLFYAYKNAEDVVLFFAKAVRGPMLRYVQLLLDNLSDKSCRPLLFMEIKQCLKHIKSNLSLIDSIQQRDNDNDDCDDKEEVNDDVEGHDNFSVLDGVRSLLSKWEIAANERTKSYKEQEKELLSTISTVLSACKEAAQSRRCLVTRSLEVDSLFHGLSDSIDQLNAILLPQREVKDELTMFLSALAWFQKLYQVLDVTVSDKLLSELDMLQESGKNVLEGLTHRKQRSGVNVSLAKVSMTNCCAFLLPIFDHFYRKSYKIRNHLSKFLVDAATLLNHDNIEYDEQNTPDEEKLCYNEVAKLVQTVKDEVPLNNPLPEMTQLEELLNLSIRMNNEITDLSNVNVEDLPTLRQLAGNIRKLPVLVTHNATLQRLLSFLEAYSSSRRVPLDICVDLGFSFTPLTYSTTVQGDALSLDKSLLDKNIKKELQDSVENIRNCSEVIELKRYLFPDDLPAPILVSHTSRETASPSVELDERSYLKICFDDARRMLDFVQQCVVVFPEEDALKFLVELPDYIVDQQSGDNIVDEVSMSSEQIQERILAVRENLLQPQSDISCFPLLPYLEKKYIEPYLRQLELWNEGIVKAWQPVKEMLDVCEKGLIIREEGVRENKAARASSFLQPYTLEGLRTEVATAIKLCRKSGEIDLINDLDQVSCFVSKCLSNRDVGGLCVTYSEQYILLEKKSLDLLDSIASDCRVLDASVINSCNFLDVQNKSIIGTEVKVEVDPSAGDNDSMLQLQHMLDRWGAKDHFHFIPLKAAIQELVHQKYKFIQLTLELSQQFPLQLLDILTSVESFSGTAYLPAVLEALHMKVKMLQSFHVDGLSYIQLKLDKSRNLGLNEREMTLWTELEMSEDARRVAGIYFAWVEFESWCLNAWHVLWSGGSLAVGSSLLEQLRSHGEQWDLFIKQGIAEWGELWVVNILTSSVNMTRKKAEKVDVVRTKYKKEERKFNQAYLEALKNISKFRHVDTASLRGHLQALVDHIMLCDGLTTSVTQELQETDLTSEGLSCVYTAADVLDSIRGGKTFELGLPDEILFQSDMKRLSSITSTSSKICRLLETAVNLEGKFLSGHNAASLERDAVNLKPTEYVPKFSEVAMCHNLWCTNNSTLQIFLSQPIFRDAIINISNLYSRAKGWADSVIQKFPFNYTLQTSSSTTRKQKQRTEEVTERAHSVDEISSMLNDPIVFAIHYPEVEALRELVSRAETASTAILEVFLNVPHIHSRDEVSALLSMKSFSALSEKCTLPELVVEHLEKVDRILSGFKSFPLSFPALDALLWWREVLTWLDNLPMRLTEVYSAEISSPQMENCLSTSSISVESEGASQTSMQLDDSNVSFKLITDNASTLHPSPHDTIHDVVDLSESPPEDFDIGDSSLSVFDIPSDSHDTKSPIAEEFSGHCDASQASNRSTSILPSDTIVKIERTNNLSDDVCAMDKAMMEGTHLKETPGLKIITIDYIKKVRHDLRSIMSFDESFENIDEGERLLLSRFSMLDNRHKSEHVTTEITDKDRSVIKFLLDVGVLNQDDRDDCRVKDMCTFPSPCPLLRRKGLPLNVFFCHPLLVTACDIFIFLRREYQRVVIWNSQTRNQTEKFRNTIKELTLPDSRDEEFIHTMREDIKTLQKSSKNDFLICGQRDICDSLLTLLLDLRKIDKPKEDTEAVGKRKRKRKVLDNWNNDAECDEEYEPEAGEEEGIPSNRSKKAYAKANDIPAEYDPDGPPWVASCSGCDLLGEYWVTFSKTGSKSYKRHKKKGGDYCGMFKQNPRLAVGQEVIQFGKGLKPRGTRHDKSDSLRTLTSAPVNIITSQNVVPSSPAVTRMTKCGRCSKIIKYSAETYYCSSKCAVDNVSQYVDDLLEYRSRICNGIMPIKQGDTAMLNTTALTSSGNVEVPSAVSKRDVKAFSQPPLWMVPRSDSFKIVESKLNAYGADINPNDDGSGESNVVVQSLPTASRTPGVLEPPKHKTATLTPSSPRAQDDSVLDVRQKQRTHLCEAFLQCFSRILSQPTKASIGLGTLSCPKAAAIGLSFDIERNLFNAYPFGPYAKNLSNNMVNESHASNQKAYSRNVLKFYRLFKSPGADTKMMELLDHRLTVQALIQADNDSLIDASRKKKQAQEISRQNLGLEERPAAVAAIIENQRRLVDTGTPAWRDGASSSMEEVHIVTDHDSLTVDTNMRHLAVEDMTSSDLSHQSGVDKDVSSTSPKQLSLKRSSSGEGESVSNKKHAGSNDSNKNVVGPLKASMKSGTTSRSNVNGGNMSISKNRGSGISNSPRAVDITSMLMQGNITSTPSRVVGDKPVTSVVPVVAETAPSFASSVIAPFGSVAPSSGVPPLLSTSPTIPLSKKVVSTKLHSRNPLSVGRPFIREDGKFHFNFGFDTGGERFNRVCIAGITDLNFQNSSGYIPREFYCRRFSLDAYKVAKSFHLTLPVRKRLVLLSILMVDEKENSLNCAYEKLVAQLEDPQKVRIMHYENESKTFEIYVYTPRQVENNVPVLQNTMTRCFRDYKDCKWLFAEVFIVDDPHGDNFQISNNQFGANVEPFPPLPPEKYPHLKPRVFIDESANSSAQVVVDNAHAAGAFLGKFQNEMLLEPKSITVPSESRAEVETPEQVELRLATERDIRDVFGDLADGMDSYDDLRDVIICCPQEDLSEEMKPYLDPNYVDKGRRSNSSFMSPQFSFFLNVVRQSIVQASKSNQDKFNWIDRFDYDVRHVFAGESASPRKVKVDPYPSDHGSRVDDKISSGRTGGQKYYRDSDRNVDNNRGGKSKKRNGDRYN